MIAPLDISTEEMEIYRLLYSRADFETFEVKYTLDQLVNDSNSKLLMTKKKVSLIIKGFENKGFLTVIRKGSKGNPTIYSITRLNEIEKHKSNLNETQRELKGNLNETNKPSNTNVLDTIEKLKGNLKETQRELKGNTKVIPIKEKEKEKEKEKDNNILSFNNDCICETNDNNSNKEPKDNYIVEKEIFDYWNSKLGTIHSQERSFTKDKTKIKTAIKTYGKDEIMTAIDRLDKAVLDTNYYYSFKWNIFKFLKQSNGITNWLDDGQLWNSYNANKEVLTTNNKSTGNNEEIEAFLRGDY